MSLGPEAVGEYNGLWLGTVVYNQDPESRNRCKVRIPGVTSQQSPVDDLPWAEYCSPSFGTGHGSLRIPDIGSPVWVMFQQGHHERPVVIGGSIIDKDTINGMYLAVTAGDSRTMVLGCDETISANRVRITQGNERHEVGGKTTYTHGDFDHSVAGSATVSYGTEHKTVDGSSTVRVEGSYSEKISGSVDAGTTGTHVQTVGEDHQTVVGGKSTLKAVADVVQSSATGKMTLTAALDAQLDGVVVKLGNGSEFVVKGESLIRWIGSFIDTLTTTQPTVIVSTGVMNPGLVTALNLAKTQLQTLLSPKVKTE